MSLAHSSSAQYDSHYKVQDEEGSSEDDAPTDYTKYFNDGINTGGVVSAVPGGSPSPPNPDSSGFVQPLDFSGFFAGGQFGGLGSLSESTNNHPIFRHSASPSPFPIPGGVNGGFSAHLETSASNNNDTYGFINPNINFHSLFDTSASASDAGFRPQDFIQKEESRGAPAVQSQFFSPAFASLKEDVDRGVTQQQREEAVALSSKPSRQRRPAEDEYDDESEGGGDYSDDSYEDGRYNPSDRNPHKFKQDKYEEKPHYPRNGAQHSSHRTPHQGKKNVKSAPSEPRPARPPRPSYQAQSQTKSEPDYGYVSPFVYAPKGYVDDDDIPYTPEPKNVRPVKNKHHQGNPNKPSHKVHHAGSYNNKQVHSPPHGISNAGPKASYSNPRLKAAYRPDHSPRQFIPQNSKPPQAYNTYSDPENSPHGQYNPYNDFRPSPSDPYLDSAPRPHQESPSNPRPSPGPSEGLFPLPQTDYASVIPRNTKPQNSDQNVPNKKVCTKVQKKINPDDIGTSRFRRQEMTCYVCNEPNTGRKYEECSYESTPNGKAYYKGNVESYSSDTVPKSYTYNTRTKRYADPFESDFLNLDDLSFAQSSALSRKIRQYSEYDDDSGSQYGHADSNYRFGPEYFTDDGTVEEGNNEGEDSGETQDSPKGNESCKKVKKDGLICVVCKNLKSAGTYEQCSYASDPEENRYSYGTQKTYGSPTPSNNDRYKRRVDGEKEEKRKLKKNSIKHKYRHNEHLDDLKHRGDFKYGKLKRKKVGKQDYDIPVQFSESVAKRHKVLKESQRRGGIGLDPLLYGAPDLPYNPDNKDKKSRNKKTESKGLEEAATSNEDDEEEEGEQGAHDDEDGDTLSYEDYFLKLFPELAGKQKDDGSGETKDEDYFGSGEEEEEEETKQSKKKVEPGFEYHASIPDYFDDTENKKDLEKVLGEFTQKDRSDCKKVMRDKMTCYQCIDKKGMQHEECMFVAASEPKSKHLAYHEVKEFRINPDGKKELIKKVDPKDKLEQTSPVTFESKENIKSIDPSFEQKDSNENLKHSKRSNGKKFKDAVTTSSVQPVATVADNLGQSAEIYDILKLNPKYESKVSELNKLNEKLVSEISDKVLNRKKRLQEGEPISSASEPEPKRDEEEGESDDRSRNVRKNYNSIPPEPESFEVPEGPEGAYSHETEPTFDSVLKISLPKYMLQRSEHEAIFDEVLASG